MSSSRPHLLEALAAQVLLCDGGMGSRVQAANLDVQKDYWDNENCTEILNLSRPDLVREIHRGYFEAGADMVLTNTFGSSPITLGEFDLTAKTDEINRRAVELAREAAESFADGRHRYVIGDIGPGTKLPSLGHIKYDELAAALTQQCRGLVNAGVDAILTETNQDTLFIKAAVNAAKTAIREAGSSIPIFVQVTVETTGTLLVGPDIAAAATVIHALDVPLLGLNCATGPQEMQEHVRWLSQNWPGLISVQPNAGLPELVDGKTHYPLAAEDMAVWMERFVSEFGMNLVGGCCGTDNRHIAAQDAMLRRIGAGYRPAPVARKHHWVPSVASLYGAVSLRQENSYFSIGERCNANGSKAWRERQEKQDWDGCVAIGREQVAEASNSLDICTAFVGRDEMFEMSEVITRFTSSVNAPLVIDSTETPVIEAALKLHGGKPIINSINFEEGEKAAEDRMKLAKKFGAAVIALTIDEVGMAKTAEDKLRIAARLVDFACTKHGLPQSDLMIDPLTFTIATGNEDDRKLGQWTLDGIRMIRDAFPDIQIMLGLSNISFGLNAAARHVLNSVFLDHAVRAGMTGAIVHVSKIKPLHAIPPEEVQVMEDLIFDRRRVSAESTPPVPPFWGAKVMETDPKALVPFINERSLYQFQWGFRKAGRSLDDFLGWAKQELRPVLKRMLTLTQEQDILKPQAIYGYWKCAGQGNDLILFEEDGVTEITRFNMPRQPKEDGDCIADFVRDIDDAQRDVIGLQVVTVGQKASDIAREWFEENRYQDYLYLHGLSVEMAEAMAEYCHKRIRAEWGFAGQDELDIEKMLSQGYRGGRYSFGYPACPKLEDQEPLLRLLKAERIGVEISDEWQLHPEQSTSAIVLHHPRAKYFSV